MRPPREPSESRSHDSSGAPLGGIVGLTMLERGYEFRCVAFIVAQWFSSALFTDDPNCLSTTSEWECKRHATVRISSWLATGRMGTPKTTQKVDGRLRVEVHSGRGLRSITVRSRILAIMASASPADQVHKQQDTYQQVKQLTQRWPFHVFSC